MLLNLHHKMLPESKARLDQLVPKNVSKKFLKKGMCLPLYVFRCLVGEFATKDGCVAIALRSI